MGEEHDGRSAVPAWNGRDQVAEPVRLGLEAELAERSLEVAADATLIAGKARDHHQVDEGSLEPVAHGFTDPYSQGA
jgi:hypothetical protein